MAKDCIYFGGFQGGIFSGGYVCNKTHKEVNNDIYRSYCTGYNYDKCPEYKRGTSDNGCYLTTITCEILGKNDDDYVLKTMRQFRDNVMSKDSKYYSILMDYDVMGPLIAYKMNNDNNKEKMAEGLYNNTLIPIAKDIERKLYSNAVKKYQTMTKELIRYYGFEQMYKEKQENYNFDNFDSSKAGHGKIQNSVDTKKRTIKK